MMQGSLTDCPLIVCLQTGGLAVLPGSHKVEFFRPGDLFGMHVLHFILIFPWTFWVELN